MQATPGRAAPPAQRVTLRPTLTEETTMADRPATLSDWQRAAAKSAPGGDAAPSTTDADPRRIAGESLPTN